MNVIKTQQSILKNMGLYQGKIDGAWGIKSQSAMSGFQLTKDFSGMYPRVNNTPFAPFEALPKGWSWTEDGDIKIGNSTVEPQVTTTVEPQVTTTVEPVIVDTQSTLKLKTK